MKSDIQRIDTVIGAARSMSTMVGSLDATLLEELMISLNIRKTVQAHLKVKSSI